MSEQARRRIEGVHQLTPLQAGMVFHSMLEPFDDTYVEQLSCRLTGPLNTTQFHAAWEAVRQRHGALRTSVHWTDGGNVRQVIHRSTPLPWAVHDLRQVAPEHLDAATADIVRADRLRGFDLSRAPLFRLSLIRLADDDHRFVWSNHHVILDGWSRNIVFGEVMDAYRALTGDTPWTPRPAPNFGEYLRWLAARDEKADATFWRSTLGGLPGPTPLPEGRAAGTAEGHARAALRLAESITGELRALARDNGVTLAAILHAAWGLLLARHSRVGRRGDVVFGTTVAGRPAYIPGADRMVGLFINTLPLRLTVDAEQSVVEWLHSVQDAMADLREHEHTPLVTAQDAAGVRDLVGSLVVVENYPLESDADPTTFRVHEVAAEERTHYPLMLVVAPGTSIELRLLATPPPVDRPESDAGPRSCARLLAQLETVLTEIAAKPGSPVGRLRMMSGAEEQRVLAAGEPEATDAADAPALIERFLACAQRGPDRVAIVSGESCLTYAALLRKARQLATELAGLGAGPESLVAVLTDRGTAQVTAVLAVHLCGAAYLPLDPGHPAERLEYVLTDSGAQTLVTSRDVLDRTAVNARVPVTVLDEWALAPAAPREHHDLPAIDPRSLAYVIYTSGSTGRPKGVEITHGNTARLFTATDPWFGFTDRDTWSLFHSLAFDFSVWELWGALAHGGRLEIVGDDARHDPSVLARMLDERAVTVLNQTPSAFARLASAVTSVGHPLAALRLVVFGGEALDPSQLADWIALHDHGVELVNMYGITETTVHVTAHRLEPADVRSSRSMIGNPIRDLRLYLLDDELRPVPPGMIGELFVGGGGLARGYRRRAGRTASRFVPDPFSERPGARLYRTGDLARLRTDGRGFDHEGRADDQIKLRGYRIEVAEVAAALRNSPTVADAVVVLRPDLPHGPGLVAYVVARAGHEDADVVAAAFAAARTRLAGYMVPSAVVTIKHVPLTANGKLDTAALPAPGDASGTAAVRDMPVGDTEQRLAAIWQQVLDVDIVDRDANFFSLGGHSLLAAQAVMRIRAELATELALGTMFEKPTIAELAAALDDRSLEPGEPAAEVPEPRTIACDPRPDRLPLTFGQQRIWFFDQWQPGTPVYNITSGMTLAGRLDRPALARAFARLIARHESLRTVFREQDGQPSQVVRSAGDPDFALIDLAGLRPADRDSAVDNVSRLEARQSFDLSSSTPLRVRLLELDAERHVLLVTVHHIVADGGSLRVMLRELTEFYRTELIGMPAQLPPLTAQYADYALWQRQTLTDAALEEQLAYWHDQLSGAPPILALPTDRPRPATMQYDGATIPFTVPPEVRKRVETLAGEVGATPYMLFIAVFQIVLAHYTGEWDVVVATAIEQRPVAEAEPLIGLFTNTLAIRTHLDDHPAFTAALERVRQVCLDAYAHQDVPFEQLVERLHPDRNLSHAPLVQVACNYQRLPLPVAQWPGVDVRPLSTSPSPGTTKFDLTLNVFETDETCSATVEYNTALFERPTAQRFITHWLSALEQLTTTPSSRVHEIDLTGPAERRVLLSEWSNVGAAGPDPRSFSRLFADQVAVRPDSTALVQDEVHYSYAGLQRRAERLAARLGGAGVTRGSLVGIHLARSPMQVVTVLAVQLCGAAHVPLDPTLPANRLAYILDDSRPVAVVSAHPEVLPATETAILDTAPGDTSAPRVLPFPVGATDLAYVIYTSGSTGRPKGTLVPQRGLAALAHGQRTTLHAAPGQRVLQFASPSFDASVFETVLALANGATLVLADADTTLPGPDLLTLLDAQAITWTVLPPTALAALPHAELSALQMLTTAGEALSPALVEQWAAGREFHNLYGPTETTVIASSTRTRPGELITIGRPFAQTRCYVLDDTLRSSPVGVPGELYLGGPGLALGYLGRAGLTAQRFVPDPYGNSPGARLYRSGDIGRWTTSGELQFLGRVDHQVKLRGYRIELGEVEAVLGRLDGVRESHALVHEGLVSTPQLVAYVAVDRDKVDVDQLRQHCAAELADYMTPGAFVLLDRLPVGPTGKVDRSALPAPGSSDEGVPYEAPASDLERALAEIWAGVLGREHVGRHDNFFALGGDSIISIQVVSRARRGGMRFPAKLLFQHPTVARLAVALDAQPPAGPVPQRAAPPERTDEPATITPTPILTWFLGLELPNPDHFNQSVLLRPQGQLDACALGAALTAVVAHHDALRIRIRDIGSTPVVDIADEIPDQLLIVADHCASSPAERDDELERVAAEAHRSLRLDEGSLVRAVLVHRGPDDERLLLVAHHVAVDGVSWRILLEDLAEAYDAARGGLRPELAPVTASYGAWAARVAEHARSAPVTNTLTRWISILGVPSDLPCDLPHDEGNTFGSAKAVAFELDRALTRRFLGSGQTTTPTQLLVAAIGRGVAAWADRQQMRLDVERHGRVEFGELDLSRTVGWFTAVHPVVVPHSDDIWADLDVVRDGIDPDGDSCLGFGLLRPALSALGSSTAADILVNYLGQTDQPFSVGGPWLPADERIGQNVDPNARRPYVFDVVGLVADGRLQVRISYSPAMHLETTVRTLADRITRQLATLLADTEPQAKDPIAAAPASGPVPGVEIEPAADAYPLTPMQTGMLFHALRDPDAQPYVVQLGGRLSGEMDTTRLRAAWCRVVERHQVLRTSIEWDGLDAPVQVVHPSVVDWTELDWRDRSTDEQERDVEAYLRADSRRGFDLTQPPLVRIALLRLGDDCWHLVWTSHHIVIDGWSLPIVMHELFSFYAALGGGAPFAPPEAIPFRRYVEWLSQRDVQSDAGFWSERLADLTVATPLPPAEAALPGANADDEAPLAQHELRLDKETSDRLRALARQTGVTLSSIVTAAWTVLLARHCDEPRVTFGLTVAGRPAEVDDVESMVGMFINTVPVRLGIDPTRSVRDWLRDVHEELLDVQERVYTPLSELHRYSRVPNGQHLFDSLVVFENYPVESAVEAELGDLRTHQTSARDQTNFTLTLTAAPGERLPLWLAYDRCVYPDDAARSLLERLGRILESIAAAPGRPVTSLDALTAAEREQLFSEWSSPNRVGSDELCLDALFAEHVQRTPDAVAVVDGDRSLTYRALDLAAERLAGELVAHDVGAESRVGVVLDRGSSHVITVLAIARIGAAYVPVDPAYPASWRTQVLSDADVELVVAAGGLDDLPGSVPVVDPGQGRAGNGPRVSQSARRDGLAYVTYTSGSTGTPKGVQISRAALAAAAAAWRMDYALGRGDRHLQMASTAFDVCTGDLTRALTTGATLVICPKTTLLDPMELARTADEQAITCAEFVPVVLRHLTGHLLARGQRLRTLRLLISGSDAWAATDYTRSRQIGSDDVRVLNSYGVTEATIDSTFYESGPGRALAPDALTPVGRPMAHARVYVLDGHGEPVAPGVVGELYIGGPGVGRGYWRQPGTTAERFVPDRFGEPGDRAYRTGDRARWTVDGQIEFLGRSDDQVKLHGHRIEPGQVESLLAEDDAVHNVVVGVRADAAGALRLVAWLVPRDAADTATLVERLTSAATRRLPQYEVPTAWVVLDGLPLTPNGKVDRRSLPSPSAPRTTNEHLQSPITESEKALAGVWQRALGIDSVGVTDNFFALGGDSIISLQVVTGSRAAGWAVTPANVFEHQTIRDLAMVAVRIDGQPGQLAEQGEIQGEVRLNPIQTDFFVGDPPAPHHYNQSVLLRGREQVDADALDEALTALLTQHDALRLRFGRDPSTGSWAAHNVAADQIPARILTRIDLREIPTDHQPATITEIATRAQSALDLDSGCLLSATLITFDDETETRLLLIVHHLVVDGVSWRVLLEDLQSAYKARRAGREVVLPPKTLAVRDWNRALVDHAQSGEVDEESAYWLDVMRRGSATGVAVDERPDAGIAEVNTRADARTVVRRLDRQMTTLLVQKTPQVLQTRVDELLLAGVVSALGSTLGGAQVLVDVEGHGRDPFRSDLDASRTVGWFTTVHPLLIEARTDPIEALRAVVRARRTVPRRGLGYGLLRRLRNTDAAAAELAALPRAVVSFNYLGRFDQTLSDDSPWTAASESTGPGQDSRATRDYLLEVDAVILDGQLSATWTYSCRLHHRETVEACAEAAVAAWHSLVNDELAGVLEPAVEISGLDFANDEIENLLSRFGAS